MPFITSENAKELGRLSGIARRNKPKSIAKELAQIAPANAQNIVTDYLVKRLARVRNQIDMLSGMLESESDAQKIDRLASALARLSEIERQLSNRPLPGSYKPERTSARRTISISAMPEPIPIAASTQPVVQPQPITQTEAVSGSDSKLGN